MPELRPMTADDISRCAAFVVRYDLEVSGYSDFTEQDLHEMTRMAGFELGADAWFGTSATGDIEAFGMIWARGDNIRNAIGLVDLAARGRGWGTALVDAIEARARQSVTTDDVVVRVHVDLADEPGMRLMPARGYEPVRRHYTMRLLLSGEVSTGSDPAGITIRTFSRDETRAPHDVLQEGFAEHWGFVPQSYEEWEREFLARSDTDPGLWFVALDGDRPVAVLVGTREGPMGWVADLAVLKPYRGRGIGAALLRNAFAEFARRGCTEVGLGVDAGNETGAVALYERVGMEPIKVYETFERRLPRS